jgi:hypothetical protein
MDGEMTNQSIFDNKFSTLNELFRKKEYDMAKYYKNNDRLRRYDALCMRLFKHKATLSFITSWLGFPLFLLLLLSGAILSNPILYFLALSFASIMLFLYKKLNKTVLLLDKAESIRHKLIKEQLECSKSSDERGILSFLNKIDGEFFEKIKIDELNKDEKQVLLTAIKAYRRNTHNSKPNDEKVEDLYNQLKIQGF